MNSSVALVVVPVITSFTFTEQVATQAPLVHQAPTAHTLVQLPQCALVPRSVSQPSLTLLLQSPQPVLHTNTTHWPFEHIPVECGGLQIFAQPPQWSASASRFASQPFNGLPSQLA